MKKFNKLFSLLVCLLLAVSVFAVPASAADSSVTYDGNSKNFIFAPGSEYSPTDLFDNFKDVMPGDTLTQKIKIKNDISKNVKVKIYLKADGAEEGSEEFLSKMNLTVTEPTGTELFKASADKTDGLTDWNCLGLFYSGAETELTVKLEVPKELGNEIANSQGKLDWEFKVEEFPVESSDPKPATGDTEYNTVITVAAISVAALCLLVLILLVLKKRRKDEEQETA